MKSIEISKNKTEAVDFIEFIANPDFKGNKAVSFTSASKIKYYLGVAMSD